VGNVIQRVRRERPEDGVQEDVRDSLAAHERALARKGRARRFPRGGERHIAERGDPTGERGG